MPVKGPKLPPSRRGRHTNIFKAQLTKLDLMVLAYKSKVRKIYFAASDLMWVWNQAQGHCMYCGKMLQVKGSTELRPEFMVWRPLRQGGSVKKENLIVVCPGCKVNHASVFRDRPRERIYDFNTIPDLICRLVNEQNDLNSCEDEYIRLYQENIKRIKRELNFAITEFVQTLAYNPRSDCVDIELERRVEEQNTAADIIARISEAKEQTDLVPLRAQLVQILKEINNTRKYNIMRF